MSFFDAAFEQIVGVEGGYTNDPSDLGGETKFGITKRFYPEVDIKNLTLEQAKDIYRRDYWERCGCDLLSWEQALCVFDTAVNQGQGIARALHVQSEDAIDLMTERAMRYAQNPQFQRFGKGWMRRLFKIFKAAQVTPP